MLFDDLDLIARKVLMSAYLYYWQDNPVLSDGENDSYCRVLEQSWDEIPLRYKVLLDPEKLFEGQLSSTHKAKFTRLVEGGALAWVGNERLSRLHKGHQAIISGEELEENMAIYELL